VPVFVSLIRAINVGGPKTIRMAALKALYERLDLDHARTHINSGNVVFATKEKDRAKLMTTIEAAIEKEFGFRPAIILRGRSELEKIVSKNPFPEMARSDPSHLLVMCLAGRPVTGAKERINAAYAGPERIHISGENVYLTYPNGIGRSKLTGALLEKHLGVLGTARNWNTLTKLLEIAEEVGSA